MNRNPRSLSAARNGGEPRAGLTLVEMLVATTASLILFGAVMAIFNVLGTAVNNSRSLSELEGELCVLTTQLVRDLTNATATRGVDGLAVNPPSGSAAGYFEIVEGPMGDLYDDGLAPRWPGVSYGKDNIVGDVDDALMFTCRSKGEPYRGNFDGNTIEEPEAEVAYFCGDPVSNGGNLPTTYTLYRRQVLVSSTAIGNGDFDQLLGTAASWTDFSSWDDFYQKYDLSVRFQSGSPDYLVLNSLNELQRRGARLGHSTSVAQDVNLPILDPGAAPWQLMTPSTTADSIISRNVLSFDVRVLDPQARSVQSSSLLPLLPSDEGYWAYPAASRSSVQPLYVDLGYSRFNISGGDPVTSVFNGNSSCLNFGGRNTFDTWSTEDSPPSPPYSVDGLAGIQVTIRLFDTRSQQIVQRTITRGF